MSNIEKFKGAAMAVPLFTTIPALNAIVALYSIGQMADNIQKGQYFKAFGHFALTGAMIFGVMATGGLPDFNTDAITADWIDPDDRSGLIGIAERSLDFNI